MKLIAPLLAAALVPTLAFAGEITLFNTTGAPVEIRAVRKGIVRIPDGQAATFLYQAEDGDFRVWTAGDKCNHIFFYETSDDAKLQVVPGPVLHKLPKEAVKAVDTASLPAQPPGWPMKPDQKECD